MEDGEDTVLERREGRTVVLTLNRPERLNAVNIEMYERLDRRLAELGRDPEVRVVVLTGAGRAFSVGADLKAHGEGPIPQPERRRYVNAAQRVNWRIQTVPRPVVAAVNGHAIGAGLEMTLSSDYVVVAAEAKLRLPEVSLGTFVGGGAVYTLTGRVGLLKAKELVLLGRFFLGAEARELGIANEAVATGEVLSRALAVADELSTKAPVSMGLAKRLLNRAPAVSRRKALSLEAEALLACMATRDWQEGIDAYREKRDPVFTGS